VRPEKVDNLEPFVFRNQQLWPATLVPGWQAAAVTRLGNTKVSRNFLSSEQRERALVTTLSATSRPAGIQSKPVFKNNSKRTMKWLHT